MKKYVLIAAVASMLFGGAFLMGQARSEPPVAQPSRVAVLRLADVLNSYKKLQARRARFSSDQKLYKSEFDARRATVEQLKQQLDELQRGTPAYQQHEERWWKEGLEAKAYMEVMQNKLERGAMESLIESYKDIIDEVKLFSQESGIDLVQIQGEVPLENARNIQELEQIINGKRIIHHSKSIDISDSIINRLNRKFDELTGRTAP